LLATSMLNKMRPTLATASLLRNTTQVKRRYNLIGNEEMRRVETTETYAYANENHDSRSRWSADSTPRIRGRNVR
jgi:hypothetical protein